MELFFKLLVLILACLLFIPVRIVPVSPQCKKADRARPTCIAFLIYEWVKERRAERHSEV
jgi:hypothetical protein